MIGSVVILFASNFFQQEADISTPQGFYRAVIPVTTGRNGYEDYVAAVAPIVGNKTAAELIFYDQLMGSREYLEYCQRVKRAFPRLQALIQEGNRKPCVYPRLDSVSSTTEFPELSHFKSAVRLLAAISHAEFAAGNVSASHDAMRTGIVFCDRFGGSGLLIHVLVANAGISVLARQYSRLRILDVASATRWEAELGGAHSPSALQSAIESELSIYEKMAADGNYSELAGQDLDVDEITDSELEARGREFATFLPALRADLLKAAAQSNPTFALKSLLDNGHYRTGTPGGRSARRLISLYKDISLLERRKAVLLSIIRLDAAVWTTFFETGQFPATLKELEPKLDVNSLPDGPYVYKLDTNRFEIWREADDDLGKVVLGERMSIPGYGFDDSDVVPPTLRAFLTSRLGH